MSKKRSVAAGWNFLIDNAQGEEGVLGTEEGESATNEAASEGHSEHGENGHLKRKRRVLEQQEIRGVDAGELLHLNDGAKLIICMMGKPSRGKTMIAGKIQRYLSWLGYRTRHIQVSEYRKRMIGDVNVDSFYDPSNSLSVENRIKARNAALKDAVQWLREKDGQIVIYDATNSTKERRKRVVDRLKLEFGHAAASAIASFPDCDARANMDRSTSKYALTYRLLWIESVCEKKEIVERHFMQSPRDDYKGMTDEEALAFFWKKVKYYDDEYEPLSVEDDNTDVFGPGNGARYNSFIKLIDLGNSVQAHRVQGYLESKLTSFCLNIHTHPRPIILVRHGESEYNLEDRLGGDPDLTEKGHEFSRNLAKFIAEESKHGFIDPKDSVLHPSLLAHNKLQHIVPSRDLSVWTSNLKRTIQTGAHIECRANVPWTALGEIDTGICEGMTYAKFRQDLPMEYTMRQRDKLNWRYPQGESYVDVKKRLEPVIFELERQRKPVLVVGHRAVLRCLYSYFVNIDQESTPFLPFPLHTVVVLIPTSEAWEERRVNLPPYLDDPKGTHEGSFLEPKSLSISP